MLLKGLLFSYFFTLYFLLFFVSLMCSLLPKDLIIQKLKDRKTMKINFRLFYQDELIINHFRLYNDLFYAYTIRIIGDQ